MPEIKVTSDPTSAQSLRFLAVVGDGESGSALNGPAYMVRLVGANHNSKSPILIADADNSSDALSQINEAIYLLREAKSVIQRFGTGVKQEFIPEPESGPLARFGERPQASR